MKYISVCSGIEAATSAWHHMGWEPVAFSEIEPFPSAVLAHHHPTVPNWGDMTKFQEWPNADVDVLVGGTPCQSFSVAGLRKGLADPRGNLMLTFGAIAQRYRPKWLVWENVPGVLSSNGGRDFGAFLGMLGELGYGFAFRVLDAQYFGVAQRRRRVFVVGCLGDWRRAAAVLFERHSLSGHPAPSRETRKDTAGSTGDGIARCITTGEMSRQDWETYNMVVQPVGTDCYNGAITGDIAATLGTPGSSVNASGPTVMQPITFGAQMSAPQTDVDMVQTLQAKNPMAVAQPMAFQSSQSGMRLCGEVHPTLDSNNGSRRHHGALTGMQVRRLTPRECERLQGFPDGHTAIPWRNKSADQCPDGPRYKALGNSMAVPVMRWIGERIAAVDQVATPGLPAASAASAT